MAKPADRFSAVTHFTGRQSLIAYLTETKDVSIQSGTLFIVRFLHQVELAVVLDAEALNEITQQLVRQLESVVNGRGLVFRIDSNDYGIVWLENLNTGRATLAANLIRRKLRSLPFCRHAGLELRPTIGISTGTNESIDEREWVNRAYLALAEASDRVPEFALFEKSMQDELDREWLLRREIADALDRQEFELHYQPRLDLSTGEPMGVEALLRWENNFLGTVEPGEFVPILETSGLTQEITAWVIRRASHELGSWLKEDTRRHFAFNASALALMDPEFSEGVLQALGVWALDSRQVVMEITESNAITKRKESLATLSTLRRQGVRISLDDFGTGFANFQYLRELPLDQIKIDRSFVRNMMRSTRDRTIVELIIQLANNFELECVAEGAETLAILSQLKELGCDAAQGYVVSQALPRNAFLEWVEGLAKNPLQF